MPLGIGIAEQAGLKDRIRGGLHARDEVGRREGGLLDLRKVVLDVPVQRQLSKAPKGDLVVRPDLGQVEDVPLEVLGLLGSQDLEVGRPARVVALFDRLEEVLGGEIGVLRGQLPGFFAGQRLDPLIGLEVDLDVDEGAIFLLNKLEGVA